VLDPLGTPAIDADIEALLEREAGEATAYEATRTGDQNSHV